MSTKITNLPAAGSVASSDIVPVVILSGPTTEKATVAMIRGVAGTTGDIQMNDGAGSLAATPGFSFQSGANIYFYNYPVTWNFSGGPAAQGAQRFDSLAAQGGAWFRTVAGVVDYPIWGADSSANLFVGSDITLASFVSTLNLCASAYVGLRVGSSVYFRANSSTGCSESLVPLIIGANPATAVGWLRLDNVASMAGAWFRDAANTTDTPIWTTDNAETIYFGSNTAGSVQALNTVIGGSSAIALNIGSTTYFYAQGGLCQLWEPAYYKDQALPATPSGGGVLTSASGLPYWTDTAGNVHRLAIYSQKLTSNFTTTSNTATTTNFTFPIAASEIWEIEFFGTVQCSSTGGVKAQISAPSGCSVEGWYESSGAAITTPVFNRITAINTLTSTITHTVGTTPGHDKIRVTVTNGATPGNITLAFASGTNTQTTTVFAGSYMKAQLVKAV